MKQTILFAILTAAVLTISCKKGTDPVDGSNATVDFRAGTKKVTGDVTVNPKDTLVFDFTISSQRAMKFVSIQKNPVNQTAFLVRDTLPDASANSYSTTKSLVADSANGSYVYRVVAHDARGIYIGHKDVVVSVRTDFNYFSNRVLYTPDTVGKSNKSFFSAADGATFSFTEGVTNSGKIDFGYYYDTTRTGSTVNGHTFYALNGSTFPGYDFGTWTKNATVFKKLTSGTPTPTFAQAQSAGTLRTAANMHLASGTTNRVIGLSTTSPHNLVYFRTANGKVGMIQINFASVVLNASGGVDTKNSFVNIDVKIEK